MKFENLSELSNIGESIALIAKNSPDQIAVAEPATRRNRPPLTYRTLTFAELELRSRQIAVGLTEAGIRPGTRLSLMIPPGIDFVAWVFGVLRAGLVAILIDPGMGRKNMVRCLSEADPEGMIGIRLAHVARALFRRRFPRCTHNFLVGSNWFPGCRETRPWFAADPRAFAAPELGLDHQAAIIFTTGSTGPPKGVLYTHRNFLAQNIQIRDYFGIQPGGTDVSGFPLFALFNAGMGTTTVFPRMDATRPAQVFPPNIIDAVHRFQANQSFGSPALWNTVARYCQQQRLQLPTLERVLTAGAPVPAHVLKRVRQLISPAGQVHTPYGATEALPVACIESRVVLGETAERTADGGGTCVGRRWPQIEWRVIKISDDPIANMEDAQPLPTGQIGELIVRGDVVTSRYVTRTEANALHKVRDGQTFWHRMGDVGYLDDQDRFWFCGRKAHRVETGDETLYTIRCEGVINTHPAVYRSALIGVGERPRQIPALIIETWPEHWPANRTRRARLLREIRELAARHELTRGIGQFYLQRKLPVDIRHNAKIFREILARQYAAWVRRAADG